MRFEWDEYHVFSDGSQSSNCVVEVYRDGEDREFEKIRVEDHTTDRQKKRDLEAYRQVDYAYWINNLDDIRIDVLKQVCQEHGLTEKDYGSCTYQFFGICANEDSKRHPREYHGTPKITIDEVLEIVEEAVCRSQYFDYDAELRKLMDRLNERKALMDECKAYLDNKTNNQERV